MVGRNFLWIREQKVCSPDNQISIIGRQRGAASRSLEETRQVAHAILHELDRFEAWSIGPELLDAHAIYAIS